MNWCYGLLLVIALAGVSGAPTPDISPAADQAALTSFPRIRFNVDFSETVAGLKAEDFTISAPGTVFSATLSGSGTNYALEVSIDAPPEAVGELCPSGYTSSPMGTFCAKVEASELAYDAAKTNCESDGANLVSVHDTEDNVFVNSLHSASFWCVCTVSCCATAGLACA